MQTFVMAPKGLLGFLYWYGLYPFHGLIFRHLIEAITERAEALSSPEAATDRPVQAAQLGTRQARRQERGVGWTKDV